MIRILAPAAAAALVLALVAAPAAAQAPGGFEMGFDVGYALLLEDDQETPLGEIEGERLHVVGAPRALGRFANTARLGYFLGERAEIEPSFGLLLRGNGGIEGHLGVGLDYLHHLGPARSRPFVRVGARLFTASGDVDGTQYGVGAGLGARTAVGERLALRYGADLTRHFESSTLPGRWELGVAIGLSLFNR